MIMIQGDSIQKRVLVGCTWYICNLSHRDNIEYWSVSNFGAEMVAEELKRNGFEVVAIQAGCPSATIQIDRSIFNFMDDVYHLNQCEDIIEWCASSVVGEFSYYYDKVIFHTADGFIAAYVGDINNNWRF